MNLLNKKGQALAEYMILLAIIGIGSLAVVQLLGRNLTSKFANIANAIQGESAPSHHGERATETHTKKRSLYDFAEGAHYED